MTLQPLVQEEAYGRAGDVLHRFLHYARMELYLLRPWWGRSGPRPELSPFLVLLHQCLMKG